MKFLVVGAEEVKKDEQYMDDKGWAFRNSFEKLGIQTECYFYKLRGKLSFIEKNKYIKDVWHVYMNQEVIRYVKRMKPDVLFIIKGGSITADTLWKIRKTTNTLIINIFTDNPLYMGKFSSIEPCHYFFVKDMYIVDTLRKAGLKNIYYLPQCTNPDVYKPTEMSEEERKVLSSNLSLIGTMYPYRLKFMEQLVEFKPAIWGKGWDRKNTRGIAALSRGKDIRGTKKAKAICASGISLNFHHPLNDIHGTNSRTFDISACKGFQLADYKSDIEDLMEIGKEIVCFRTIDELKELIKYYLQNPAKRIEIAEAAYRRVLKDHTYDVRAKQIMEIINV